MDENVVTRSYSVNVIFVACFNNYFETVQPAVLICDSIVILVQQAKIKNKE